MPLTEVQLKQVEIFRRESNATLIAAENRQRAMRTQLDEIGKLFSEMVVLDPQSAEFAKAYGQTQAVYNNLKQMIDGDNDTPSVTDLFNAIGQKIGEFRADTGDGESLEDKLMAGYA